jgi:hypothetical protein
MMLGLLVFIVTFSIVITTRNIGSRKVRAVIANRGVQHILCCVFVLFFIRVVYPMLTDFLDFPSLIDHSVFSNAYLSTYKSMNI